MFGYVWYGQDEWSLYNLNKRLSWAFTWQGQEGICVSVMLLIDVKNNL